MVHRSCYQGKPDMSQYFVFTLWLAMFTYSEVIAKERYVNGDKLLLLLLYRSSLSTGTLLLSLLHSCSRALVSWHCFSFKAAHPEWSPDMVPVCEGMHGHNHQQRRQQQQLPVPLGRLHAVQLSGSGSIPLDLLESASALVCFCPWQCWCEVLLLQMLNPTSHLPLQAPETQ
jgi:hypothetical protein